MVSALETICRAAAGHLWAQPEPGSQRGLASETPTLRHPRRPATASRRGGGSPLLWPQGQAHGSAVSWTGARGRVWCHHPHASLDPESPGLLALQGRALRKHCPFPRALEAHTRVRVGASESSCCGHQRGEQQLGLGSPKAALCHSLGLSHRAEQSGWARGLSRGDIWGSKQCGLWFCLGENSHLLLRGSTSCPRGELGPSRRAQGSRAPGSSLPAWVGMRRLSWGKVQHSSPPAGLHAEASRSWGSDCRST